MTLASLFDFGAAQSWNAPLVLLLIILLGALAIRLAYWERSASFGAYELSYDDDEYYQLGDMFARGEFFRDPFPLR